MEVITKHFESLHLNSIQYRVNQVFEVKKCCSCLPEIHAKLEGGGGMHSVCDLNHLQKLHSLKLIRQKDLLISTNAVLPFWLLLPWNKVNVLKSGFHRQSNTDTPTKFERSSLDSVGEKLALRIVLSEKMYKQPPLNNHMHYEQH